MRLTRVLSALALTATALFAALAVGVAPAHAAETKACDPNGTTTADADLARRLNQSLPGAMRGRMDAYRVSCARVIASTILGRDLPVRAARIAITTTIVESTIRNLTYGDRDSLGLFQQRPSQGWGDPDQIMNPVYSTNKFIDKMLKISDWRTGPIGRICQDVQVSAYPDRYNDATPDGVAIADAVWELITTPERRVGSSVTGDPYTDVLAVKPNGTLWLYANNIERDDGIPYSAAKEVGRGWGVFDRIIPADVTGDGYTDVVALKPDGTMWLYPNNIERDNGMPYSGTGVEIGHNWNIFTRIFAADVTGDGYADIIAFKPDGTMWLYRNNIERDNGVPYGGATEVGHGWNIFDRVFGADVTGDGYTDLVGVKPDGTVWLYLNNIERDDGIPYGGTGRQIGKGWNAFDLILPADATGDGYADLVGVKSDGTMWLYLNNYERDDGVPYGGTGREIGHNWNIYERILA